MSIVRALAAWGRRLAWPWRKREADQGIPRDAEEALARAVHEDSLRFEQARGQTRVESEFLVPWDELPEPMKESCRAFVARIGHTLATLGYTLVAAPSIAPDAPRVQFSSSVLEALAKYEHEHWMENALDGGWQFGAEKDAEHKTHPDLVPWEELTDEEQERDRESVRRIPSLLAQAKVDFLRLDERLPGHASGSHR